jgi:hypothetical protein
MKPNMHKTRLHIPSLNTTCARFDARSINVLICVVLDVARIVHSETSMFSYGLNAGRPATHCSQCTRVPHPRQKNGRVPPTPQLHRQHHPEPPPSLISLKLCVVCLSKQTPSCRSGKRHMNLL